MESSHLSKSSHGTSHHHGQNNHSSHNHNKPRNYKLLIDPFLVKGSTKVYRYDGTVQSDSGCTQVQVRDPRSQLTRIWTRIEPLELKVPHFKVTRVFLLLTKCMVISLYAHNLNVFIFQIDANYVGAPPPLEVTISNLNDNIDKAFLSELVSLHFQEIRFWW